LRLAPLLVLLAACSPSSSGGDFTGGNFDFETTGVQDGCYDGSFEVLFLPEGAGTTNPWGDPIYVPGEDELPSTYDVALPDPFTTTEVEVTGDAETRTVTGAVNSDVELDADNYPGCLVDMNIDVELVIVDADTVQGTATLHTAGFDEGSCPVVEADPCDITLDIQGARL
jgi:hypothetical protein